MKYTFGSIPKSVVGQISEKLNTNNICFLYPFLNLFEEDLYLIDTNRRTRHSPEINTKWVSVAWSAVAVKRLIRNIRHWDFLINSYTNKLTTDLYFYPMVRLIVIILVLFFPFHDIKSINNKLETSKSIHSIFLFLEDRFIRSNLGLKVDFPHEFHLETPIRLFRRQIKDVSFPHLSRTIFCREKIFCRRTIYFHEEERRGSLSTLIQNFYIFVIDSVLLIPWRDICKLRVNDLQPLDTWNIFRKERFFLASPSIVNTISVDSHFNRRLCLHYARWTNYLVVVFEGTRYFREKWISYLHIILTYHFHFRIKFDEQLVTSTVTGGVSFLGYILVVQTLYRNIWIKSQIGFYITLLNVKKFYTQIPNSVIITILIQRKFCNIYGWPIGKLTWVSSTDTEIINRYGRLCQVFLFYYGVSRNSLRLRKLIYILQISRNITLAIKHKSTIRMLLNRFNLNISKPILVVSKYKSLHSSKRFWWSGSIWFVLIEFSIFRI